MVNHLLRRNGVFYQKQHAPQDLTSRLGLVFLRRSLGTRDPRTARARLLRSQVAAETLFRLCRDTVLTDDECRAYARWWLSVCLDQTFAWRQLGTVEHPDAETAAEINDGLIAGRGLEEAAIVREIARGEIGRVELHARLALEEDGRAEDANSNDDGFRRLCAYILRATLEATRRARAEDQGDFEYETRDPLFKGMEPPPVAATVGTPVAKPLPPPMPVSAPNPSSPPIRSLIESFIEEKTRLGQVSEKTVMDYRTTMTLFLLVVGEDAPVASITGRQVADFSDLLQRTPSNFRKRFNTNDFREAIRLNAERTEPLDTLDPKTINLKYLSNVKTFFEWCRKKRHVDLNPASGVSVETPKGARVAANRQRDAFTVEELTRLFKHPDFSRFKPRRRRHYLWAPLIGLYAGLRLNEIGQLLVSDLVQVNGMPHFLVSESDDEEDGKRVKSMAGQRLVPVHRVLVGLGIMEHAASLPADGRLWPEWDAAADGFYSSTYSKHFTRVLADMGIKRPRLSFHSLRHSFADALRAVFPNSDEARNRLMGHASQHVGSRYGSPTIPAEWSKAFQSLSYPGLDLSHLKRR